MKCIECGERYSCEFATEDQDCIISGQWFDEEEDEL